MADHEQTSDTTKYLCRRMRDQGSLTRLHLVTLLTAMSATGKGHCFLLFAAVDTVLKLHLSPINPFTYPISMSLPFLRGLLLLFRVLRVATAPC